MDNYQETKDEFLTNADLFIGIHEANLARSIG